MALFLPKLFLFKSVYTVAVCISIAFLCTLTSCSYAQTVQRTSSNDNSLPLGEERSRYFTPVLHRFRRSRRRNREIWDVDLEPYYVPTPPPAVTHINLTKNIHPEIHVVSRLDIKGVDTRRSALPIGSFLAQVPSKSFAANSKEMIDGDASIVTALQKKKSCSDNSARCFDQAYDAAELVCPPGSWPDAVKLGVCITFVGPPLWCPPKSVLHTGQCRRVFVANGELKCPKGSYPIAPGQCAVNEAPQGSQQYNSSAASSTKVSEDPTTTLDVSREPETVHLLAAKNSTRRVCLEGRLSSNQETCIQHAPPLNIQCPEGFQYSILEGCTRKYNVSPVLECPPGMVFSETHTDRCQSMENLASVTCPADYDYNLYLKECQRYRKKQLSLCPEGYEVLSSNSLQCIRNQSSKIDNTQRTAVSKLQCPERFTQVDENETLCRTPPLRFECPPNTEYRPRSPEDSEPCQYILEPTSVCPAGYTLLNTDCARFETKEPVCSEVEHCAVPVEWECGEGEILDPNDASVCILNCSAKQNSSCDTTYVASRRPKCPEKYVYNNHDKCVTTTAVSCPFGTFEFASGTCKKTVLLLFDKKCPEGTYRVGQHCFSHLRTAQQAICPEDSTFNNGSKTCELQAIIPSDAEVSVSNNTVALPCSSETASGNSACVTDDIVDRSYVCPDGWKDLATSQDASNSTDSNIFSGLALLRRWSPDSPFNTGTSEKNWCLASVPPLAVSYQEEKPFWQCPPQSMQRGRRCIRIERALAVGQCSRPEERFNPQTRTCISQTPSLPYSRPASYSVVQPTYQCPPDTMRIGSQCVGLFTIPDTPVCPPGTESRKNFEGIIECYKLTRVIRPCPRGYIFIPSKGCLPEPDASSTARRALLP